MTLKLQNIYNLSFSLVWLYQTHLSLPRKVFTKYQARRLYGWSHQGRSQYQSMAQLHS